jgi:glycosyltransferase involved in cell wall biosynthesis
MKVCYDISVLGRAAGNNSARTGIFRVVENLAIELAKHSEINLHFTALRGLRDCLNYIEKHPDLNYTQLAYKKFPFLLDDLRYRISNRIQYCDFPVKDALKASRELLNGTKKILSFFSQGKENIKCPIDGIFHSPYFPIPKRLKSEYRFITVYDLIPILSPQYFDYKSDHLLHNVINGIDFETWVFCISEATKNDLLNYNKSVDPDKVAIIPLGASDLFYNCIDPLRVQTVKAKYGIPDAPYFLSLSTLEPRKNIESTIRSFVKLVRQENITDLYLVLVGTKGWNYTTIFDQISASKELTNRIIVTGYVDDQDLAPIYSGALAFVYPSFYEGFGLPPLEAMQCGIPVITSNTSSLPEVVGDAGIQIDPDDNDALCQAMLNMLKNNPLRQDLSKRSFDRAKHFSWDACAKKTICHYRKAMQLHY